MGKFPREVVIHAQYGGGYHDGLSRYDYDENSTIKGPYDILEHEVIVDFVKNNRDKAETAQKCIEAGFHQNIVLDMFVGDDYGYCLFDWDNASVVTVTGPYRINEYDGYESIVYQSDTEWRH